MSPLDMMNKLQETPQRRVKTAGFSNSDAVRRAEALLTSAEHEYGKGLSRHSFFKLQNRGLSEDLVQDTFMRTWSYLVKGGKIDVMKAFLYHILNNLIVDEYRKHKTLSLDVLLEDGYEPAIDERGRLYDILDGKAALLLIQRLPEVYRKVMRMRYIQDLSLEEMSGITGQSRNALCVQLHRGLKRLKLLYGDTAVTG
ncbi:hypothetical protein A3H16_02415 [Candidatus Kaiserbacteria bacterium RIFCSPLOWO2_12_FULL_53_8]|uniref:RNA polymerase sigma factor n=2 Tax=Candidatus Kaiseribacteriota TaxID=1752734 RepID=A0A1F6CTA1_9BACT|nr:MAG: hypothetical protein A2851_05165 [Candidatus Kaiserbacteria bacterium RIFCSPHIGHO2_01_FULL_53_29]OGG91936.1 MAG: hypothetical protein A3H16_02415 [Candidatus Kaiserbacteria bacterium RIFCSPLOWO2_12_FULL_53_8]